MRRQPLGDATEPADTPLPKPGELVSRPVRLPLGRDDEIAAGVHEVQNALTSVLGWIEVARNSDDATLRDRALRVIHAGVERTRNLVARLADPAERFSVRPQAFRVSAVVAEAHELLHPRCASVGVALELRPGGDELVALGDPDRLMQVVTNLVLNAVDAVLAIPQRASDRGRVELAVTSDERHVQIEVRDDGTGMDEATLARAFEPYFTTHPTASGRRKAGSGLGLAISRALAEAMGGSLDVNSAPGEGTRITISLPREGMLPSIKPPPDAHDLNPGTRVLVVDDEPAIRELLEVALALRGADVTTAATLAEARETLAHRSFDVVLVDETLGPRDSGASFVVDLGQVRPELPRVLMTGAPSVDHLPAEAARHLLRKPFSLDEVVRVISKALDGNAARSAE
jgi:CheY-like chemotaxis protein/anti-sigma regulatory factor (Ser/Thr protein kinase)